MAKKIPATSNLLFESNNTSLQSMVEKIYFLQGVNQVLQSLLEQPLAKHCRVANIRQGCIIIETDSSAFATLLRYQFPVILQNLRKTPGLESLRSIDYYIAPAIAAKTRPPLKKPPALSPQCANFLQEIAQGIKNEALQNTLLNIANRRKLD